MNIIYNLGISLYSFGVRIASVRNKKARLMREGQAQTFGILDRQVEKAEKYVWIHVSSLGEFEQGRPLIEMMKRNNPSTRILLTFFSPSGYEVCKNYTLADIICYLPFDKPKKVRRFLDAVDIEKAIFVKYEFWGNYLHELHRRAIPTYIISAIFRPTQMFFRPYGGLFRKMLHCYDTLFVQDEQSATLLRSVGVTNVEIAGDTRFDRVTDILENKVDLPIVEIFSRGSFTLFAGSSWEHDEDIIIPYFNEHSGMKLILAPHVVSDSHIERIKQALKRPAVCITDADEGNVAEADCLIVNTYGMLSSIYRYGRVAYVGGGFGVGIHNVPEAAVYGVPVIIGPNHRKFREANALLAEGGCMEITSPETFAMTMDLLLGNEERRSRAGAVAGEYIRKNAGASDAIFNAIKW